MALLGNVSNNPEPSGTSAVTKAFSIACWDKAMFAESEP
jgi:hypothetical protein